MKFTERPEFHYDPEVFKLSDVQTALKIHHEMVVKHSARPRPKFFELDRSVEKLDALWHIPLANGRDLISRTLELSAINQFVKNDWRLTKVGLTPTRRDVFWLSFLGLQEADYFPQRGDLVWWNGYRYMLVRVDMPPEAYWQQTNVWLGLKVECTVTPEGDAMPMNPRDVINPMPIEKP